MSSRTEREAEEAEHRRKNRMVWAFLIAVLVLAIVGIFTTATGHY